MMELKGAMGVASSYARTLLKAISDACRLQGPRLRNYKSAQQAGSRKPSSAFKLALQMVRSWGSEHPSWWWCAVFSIAAVTTST